MTAPARHRVLSARGLDIQRGHGLPPGIDHVMLDTDWLTAVAFQRIHFAERTVGRSPLGEISEGWMHSAGGIRTLIERLIDITRTLYGNRNQAGLAILLSTPGLLDHGRRGLGEQFSLSSSTS